MKRFKINLAVIAFSLAIVAAFAFKVPAKHLTEPYWQYNGSGSVTDPASYTELPGDPSCGTTGNICAIMAPEDTNNPGEPLIDSGLSTRITNKDKSDGDVFLHQN